MPISLEEFKHAWSIHTALTSFLREHRQLAFTLEELTFEMQDLGLPVQQAEVEDALLALRGRGHVDAHERYGVMYYAFNTQLGFRPPNKD